ncbi:hypothetical protein ACET3Z_025815 [Daucus carota]
MITVLDEAERELLRGRGKLYEFSHATSLNEILQKYHDVTDIEERETIGIFEPKSSKYAGKQADEDLLPRVQRYLAELDFDQLHVPDLVQLEKELESALVQTKAAKIFVNTQQMMKPVTTLQEKEKLLREENELLAQQIAAMAKENTAAKDKTGEAANDETLKLLW